MGEKMVCGESNAVEKSTIGADPKYAEHLQKMIEFHYLNFDRRRTYEWKLCLVLWTALAAFIAVAWKNEIPTPPVILEGVVYVGIVILQFYFLKMILDANVVDKDMSHYYQDALNEIMGTDWNSKADCKSKRLSKRMKRFKSRRGYFSGRWTNIVQIGITCLLLVTVYFVLHAGHDARGRSTAGDRNCIITRGARP